MVGESADEYFSDPLDLQGRGAVPLLSFAIIGWSSILS